MEFKGLKIDFNAIAALVTAIGGLILVVKGTTQRKKKKEEKSDE